MVRHMKIKKTHPDSFYQAETTDGVTLWMKRYRPKKGKIAPYPIVLCHGLLANKNSLDFGEPTDDNDIWDRFSLAGFLYNGGDDGRICYDVWVPELRGRRSYSEYDIAKRGQVPETLHWCVDDYIDKDVPAIIKTIKKTYEEEQEQFPGLFWIGMSMGGMLAYAHGQTAQGKQDFKGVITIGSPVSFEYSHSMFAKLKSFAPRNMFIRLNLRSILENNIRFKDMFLKNALKTGNCDKEDVELYIEAGFDNSISSKVLSHFGIFYRHKTFCRYPSRPWVYDLLGGIPLIGKYIAPYSWTANLFKFTSPLLAIAGSADDEAPIEEVQYARDHVGSSDVGYLECSLSSSIGKEYSHLDFHLGKNVKEEVYPHLYHWLVTQSKTGEKRKRRPKKKA